VQHSTTAVIMSDSIVGLSSRTQTIRSHSTTVDRPILTDPPVKSTIHRRHSSSTFSPASGELTIGQRVGIIIAACAVAVLIVLVTGFVTHRVLKHYSWWHISSLRRRRDTVDGGKRQIRTVSLVDIERAAAGHDNAGAFYDFNETAHPY